MYLARLVEVGIENICEDDIVCTAWILATYLKSINFEKKVFLIGNSSIASELDAQNISHTSLSQSKNYQSIEQLQKDFELDSDIQCVAVGYDFHFSYSKITIGTTYATKPGCLFLATNDDAGKQLLWPSKNFDQDICFR
jgi:phosphoglycolate phosphatase